MTHHQTARVRFAPSPTGRFHIGGARTALYDYLIARQTGGQFILRIEDTDRKRYVAGAEQEIMDALRWLGLSWDEGPDIGGTSGPYRQSERMEIYQEHIEVLLQQGDVYPCFCTPDRLAQLRTSQRKRKEPPRYDGRCRGIDSVEARSRVMAGEAHTVRFKTPQSGETTAVDALRGEITIQNETLDDMILMKSDGLPVYHLAVVVDDHLMRITHVLRSSEWLPTFPLHVMLYRAFGWEQPVWVHPSVFLNPSGKGKMSKRSASDAKGGAASIYTLDLKEAGYLPEAVINWLALMGWAYDDHTEFFTLPDLIEKFSIAKMNPSPAAVNYSKLDHFNGLHIRALAEDDLARRLLPYFHAAGLEIQTRDLEPIVPLIQERIRTLDDAVEIAGFFFRPEIEIEPEALTGKDMTAADSATALRRTLQLLQQAPAFEPESLEADLRALAQELGLKPGQLFGILRIAVTGQKVSPPLIESMVIVGKATVLERIETAAQILERSI